MEMALDENLIKGNIFNSNDDLGIGNRCFNWYGSIY